MAMEKQKILKHGVELLFPEGYKVTAYKKRKDAFTDEYTWEIIKIEGGKTYTAFYKGRNAPTVQEVRRFIFI